VTAPGETLTYPYPFSPRREVLPLVPASARSVLDVGCGLGGFGATLREADPTRAIWAIESDPMVADTARAHYDRVLVGRFPDVLDEQDGQFDCIVFNDVLEHMIDPWAALRRATRHLTDRGTVVASIPNVRFVRTVVDLVVRGDWTYTESGVLDRTHLRFFTRKTIYDLFEESGYDVEALHGINWVGHARTPLSRVFPALLGDFAYSGFAVAARPSPSRRATLEAGSTESEQGPWAGGQVG
jgi:2-polyprenyl-3-methyl-5-hydroxy-6-metoxy-1,4-benzoquinol methylase